MSDRRLPFWLGMSIVPLWISGIAIGLVAAGDGVLDIDVRVARQIQRLNGPVAGAIASYGNWIGRYWVGAAFSLPILALLAWWRHWREAALLIAVLVVRALNNTIKSLFDSPRPSPDLIQVTEDLESLGFPSGHASGAALLFGALTLLTFRFIDATLIRLTILVGAVATVVAVCFGRVHTGAHWPSDAIGGVLLALAVLFTLVWLLGLASGGTRDPGSGSPDDSRDSTIRLDRGIPMSIDE